MNLDIIQPAQDDHRLRMILDSSVAAAMDAYGPIDPEQAERAAFEIATHAVTMAISRIVKEDAEIMAARAERDHYRAIAEKALFLSPTPIILAKP